LYTPEQRQQLDGLMRYLQGRPNAPPPQQPTTRLGTMGADPKKMSLGYDPNVDEMTSGVDFDAITRRRALDQGMVRTPPASPDRLQVDPNTVPKQPLQQVPEDQLLPERPNFYQRQFNT
jgi:hypothetical protein